jgi:hypothetical protein
MAARALEIAKRDSHVRIVRLLSGANTFDTIASSLVVVRSTRV